MTVPTVRKEVVIVPRTWLGRLAAAVFAAALIVPAVFFFTIVLGIFAVLAIVVVVKVLWVQRKGRRKTAKKNTIDAEYVVITSSRQRDHETRRAENKHVDDDHHPR